MARGGEIVIVTILQRAMPDLPWDLFAGVPEDVAVVDTGNYYPVRDSRIYAIEGGQAESAWVAEHLGRPVVKAFNNIVSQSLLENGRPEGAPGRVSQPSQLPTGDIWGFTFWLTSGARSQILLTHGRVGDAER